MMGRSVARRRPQSSQTEEDSIMRRNHARSSSAVVLDAPSPRQTREACIEYPKKDEVIGHPSYSFQIGAIPAAMRVDVAIDQGDWKPCRESLGLWWYDWSGYDSGEHEIVARVHKEHGKTALSQTRHFTVRLPAA
jgi:hypothetical protein